MGKNKIIKNIVILRTDRIGEVLLSTVAIDAVREKYPSSKISFITSEYSRPLLEGRGDIENLEVFNTYGKGNVLSRALLLASMLEKGRYDAAVILNPHKILHLGCFFAGIPIRVGYNRKWPFCLNRTIDDRRTEGKKHEVEYTMDLLRLIDVDTVLKRPRIFIPDDVRKSAVDIIMESGRTAGRPLISIHPGSSNPDKIWSVCKYSDLIRLIKEKTDCDIAVLGSVDESDIVSDIITSSGAGVVDLSGKLDLMELSAVLEMSYLFIGNDAGPAHMAAAFDIPVIAIFGKTVAGTNPARWRPWTDNSIIFHETSERDDNIDLSCKFDYICAEYIDAEDVFNALKRIIGP